ncbi:MAG: NAD(P)/FAD-dependent oxidoreductase [Burkholderiaceae bacterium]
MAADDPTRGATREAPAIEHCDVAVVGGGPAGSTISTLLSRRGHRVMLFEKDRHPRFHIGESLLPRNLPLLETLGVADEVARIGMYKPSVEFHAPGDDRSQPFRFADAIDPSHPHAWQVRRSEFDQILFRNAERNGVLVHEQTRVADAAIDADGVTLSVIDADGAHRRIRAAHLVDASGRDTFMSGRLGRKIRHPRHMSAAIYGHFTGARRLDGEREGAISVFWFEHGWFWFIPLSDGTTSVGAVCWPYYLKTRRTDPSRFLLDTIEQAPVLAQRLRDAKLIAPATATGNYSYLSTRMTGDRVTLVGDSLAFIDGLLQWRLPRDEKRLLRGRPGRWILQAPGRSGTPARRLRTPGQRGLRQFSWLIFRMTHPIMQRLFLEPRNDLRLRDAVVSLLAGDVYGRFAVDWRLWMFKAVFYANLLTNPRIAWRAWRRRRVQIAPSTVQATDGSG